jgi:hypothetical protein
MILGRLLAVMFGSLHWILHHPLLRQDRHDPRPITGDSLSSIGRVGKKVDGCCKQATALFRGRNHRPAVACLCLDGQWHCESGRLWRCALYGAMKGCANLHTLVRDTSSSLLPALKFSYRSTSSLRSESKGINPAVSTDVETIPGGNQGLEMTKARHGGTRTRR